MSPKVRRQRAGTGTHNLQGSAADADAVDDPNYIIIDLDFT